MIFWSKNMATCQIWKWESLDKIQHYFMIKKKKQKKKLDTLGIEGNFLNKKKTLTEKLRCNITLNDERLDVFPTMLGTRSGRLLSPLLFNLVPHHSQREETTQMFIII